MKDGYASRFTGGAFLSAAIMLWLLATGVMIYRTGVNLLPITSPGPAGR